MNKRLILITAAVGAISFLGAFAAGWFTKSSAAKDVTAPPPSADGTQTQTDGVLQPQILAPTQGTSDDKASTRAMTEQQLKELIYEVREKIQQYDAQLDTLEKEKERLRIAQQILKKDIETLNNLRTDLATTVASVKTERDRLLKTRVQVEQAEKANLVAISAAYDKMDPTSAADILTNMAMGKNGGNGQSVNIDDAVKILHFMQERTKAKVLAALVTTEPSLAALLCQRLKQVREGK